MLSCYALDSQRVLVPHPTRIRVGHHSALLEVPVNLPGYCNYRKNTRENHQLPNDEQIRICTVSPPPSSLPPTREENAQR